jgi:hypothetical protein
MAQAIYDNITSKFDNWSAEMLADALGEADARLKGIETETAALKEEIRRRGGDELVGKSFTVTVRAQITKRLDVAAVRAHLGDAIAQFEIPSISQVVRIKAVRLVAAA